MPKINLDSLQSLEDTKDRVVAFKNIINKHNIELPASRAEICSCGAESAQLLNQLILDGLIGGYKYSHCWTPLGKHLLDDISS